jgi:hypothetical protein
MKALWFFCVCVCVYYGIFSFRHCTQTTNYAQHRSENRTEKSLAKVRQARGGASGIYTLNQLKSQAWGTQRGIMNPCQCAPNFHGTGPA